MKKILLSTYLFLGFAFVSPANAKITREERNVVLVACVKKISHFLGDDSYKTIVDERILGQNKAGQCSLSSYINFFSSERVFMHLWMGSENSDYYSSIEASPDDGSWPGIYSQVVKCDVGTSELDVIIKYVVPQDAKIWSDGTLTTLKPFFNSVERQVVKISKDATGKIKSSTIKTKIGGQQNCTF